MKIKNFQGSNKFELMKFIALLIILVLLVLVGCKQEVDNGVVDNLTEEAPADDNTEEPVDNKALFEKLLEEEAGVEVEEEEDTGEEDTEPVDNKALFEELMGGNETEEEEEEEEIASGTKEVEIENFKATPEDFSITVDTTVVFRNLMHNFVQIIMIMPKEEDGSYASRWVNELVEIAHNETYEYTFNETGMYKWGSKTKYDKINGIITVT